MKDNEYNEYYIKAEEWPGPEDEKAPKDEPATLDESASFVEGSTIKKKDAKVNKKAQKKKADLLNKSAGLLVSAAAVVMVAGTITKENIMSIQDMYSYICPICSVENCELWDDRRGEETTTIELNGSTYTILSVDENQLGIVPYSEEWREIENRTSAIYMQDGRRAYIKSISTEYIDYEMTFDTSCDDRDCLVPATDVVVREIMCAGDIAGDGNKHITLIELIYMPDGTKPEEENLYYEMNGDFIADLPYVYLKLLPNEDKLWLRISTTEDTLDLEGMWNDTDVGIVDSSVDSFEMGSTMIFKEDAEHRRTWYNKYSASGHHGWGGFDYGYVSKYERISYDFVRTGTDYDWPYLFYVEFMNVAYEQIHDRWQELNELAQKRGHTVWIPVYRFDEYEYNGISYQMYLIDRSSVLNSSYELICSPTQEKNCVVRVTVDEPVCEAKDLHKGGSVEKILTTENMEMINQILYCIYLKANAPDTDISSVQEGTEGNKVTQNPLVAQNVPVAGNKALLDLSEYEDVGWSNGGVVPVKKDGLWGLIDYYGNEILEPTYTGFWSSPNNNGYTIFYDSAMSEYYVINKEGEEVFTWQGEVLSFMIGGEDIIRVGQADGLNVCYTYYRLDGSVLYDTGWYEHEGALSYNNAMLFKDGVAYYSGTVDNGGSLYDFVLYKVNLDGTVSVQEECSYVPANNYSEGCMLVYNWGYATGGCQIYDLTTHKLSNYFDYVSGDLVPDFDYSQNSIITDWSYEGIGENGYYMSNYGPYCVLNLRYDGDKTKDILINYWDVEDYHVLNSCIAMYDDIIFDNYKYLAVQDGDQWYYIDLDGDIVSGPYQDASSFNNEGYALVMEDNVAYLINDKFEALEKIENVEAASVSLNNSRFLIKGTDEALYLYNHDMN